jgi:hypothetical protein
MPKRQTASLLMKNMRSQEYGSVKRNSGSTHHKISETSGSIIQNFITEDNEDVSASIAKSRLTNRFTELETEQKNLLASKLTYN